MNTGEKEKKLSVTIPEDVYAYLEDEAVRENTNIGSVITEIVRDILADLQSIEDRKDDPAEDYEKYVAGRKSTLNV
ncbi:MAG: hypothetical protein HQK89_04960 [Nitrospirae bacterium]|nr:hypothetical protein [Nitrospirota bacterium]